MHKNGYKFFLLLRDEKQSQEVQANFGTISGNTCPKNKANQFPFIDVLSTKKLRGNQKAFVLISKTDSVSDLNLIARPFKKITSAACTKKGYQTSIYQTDDKKISYFSQTTDQCDWQYFGLLNQESCNLTGQSILDCPNGGPTAKGFYGRPEELMTLLSKDGSENYIVSDSSFWEYFGLSIGRVDGDRITDTRLIFEDACSGT